MFAILSCQMKKNKISWECCLPLRQAPWEALKWTSSLSKKKEKKEKSPNQERWGWMWSDTCWMSFFCCSFDKLLRCLSLSSSWLNFFGCASEWTLLAWDVSTVLLKQHDWSWSEDIVSSASQQVANNPRLCSATSLKIKLKLPDNAVSVCNKHPRSRW